MKLGFAIITICCVLISCYDDSRSRQALDNAGFTDIVITGYEPFGCGDDDTFSTGFKAKNSKGTDVEGIVCCGVVKACTIRY